MEYIPKVVKLYRSNVLIYQGNEVDTWNQILEPDDILDTGQVYHSDDWDKNQIKNDEPNLKLHELGYVWFGIDRIGYD